MAAHPSSPKPIRKWCDTPTRKPIRKWGDGVLAVSKNNDNLPLKSLSDYTAY